MTFDLILYRSNAYAMSVITRSVERGGNCCDKLVFGGEIKKMKTMPGISLQVQNIFCIGRNYAEHAKELGNAVPTEPVIFMKPTSTICYSGDTIELPEQSSRVDHEVEIVIAIGRKAKFISAAEALSYIAGIGIGIDLTARDIQEHAKQKGLPWTRAKGFDRFAPISQFVSPPTDPSKLDQLNFDLH